jgi:hypothetical protein
MYKRQASTRKAGWSLFSMRPQIESGHFWVISALPLKGCQKKQENFSTVL